MGGVIAPASVPQQMFLETPDWVDICFYGGQAGGGKTWAGMAHHLKYVEDPLYRGLTLRRTTPMLLKSGAVWDEAKQLYSEYDPNVKIKIKDLKIVFSSQGEVAFSHFERVEDTKNFQGAQISSCVMEELTQFEESQFNYILSRLRTRAKMKPNLRATMNPETDSWCRKFVDWYLYDEDHELAGRPDSSKQGIIRWFVRLDNELYWASSREELLDRFPKSIPLAFRFISASVYDNPHIEPSYIAFLEGLPQLEKELLLYGNWNARPEGSTYFQRSWVEEVDYIDPDDIVESARSFDFASTLKDNAINYNPDYTASVLMHKLKDGRYCIADVVRHRIRVGDWTSFVLDAAKDDPADTTYYLPQDPGPSAKRAMELFARELAEKGMYTRKLTTNQKKLERFRPFSSMAQNSGVVVIKGCATDLENKVYNDNTFFYKELEVFTGIRKRGEMGHDDMVDCVSDSFYALASNANNFGNISKGLAGLASIVK